MSYKIRISCTSSNQFMFNGKKITDKLMYNLGLTSQITYLEYVTAVVLLYKKLSGFTTKTLEFFCTNEISENQFVEFIKFMKCLGFSSQNKECSIDFMVDGDIKWKYNFHSLKSMPIEKKTKMKNNSFYMLRYLYKNKQ